MTRKFAVFLHLSHRPVRNGRLPFISLCADGASDTSKVKSDQQPLCPPVYKPGNNSGGLGRGEARPA